MVKSVERLTQFLNNKSYIIFLALIILSSFGMKSKPLSIFFVAYVFVFLGLNMLKFFIKKEGEKFFSYTILTLLTTVTVACFALPY